MSVKKQTKSGGARKIGRCLRKASKQNYVGRDTRFKNKVKRIRQSNGEKYLKQWLKANDGSTARRPSGTSRRTNMELWQAALIVIVACSCTASIFTVAAVVLCGMAWEVRSER